MTIHVGRAGLFKFAGHEHEVLAPRVWSLAQMKYHSQKFAIAFKLPIILTLVYLARALLRGQAVLLRSYGIVALVTAIIFAGGEGTSFNTFLDVAVFLGIGNDLGTDQFRELGLAGQKRLDLFAE